MKKVQIPEKQEKEIDWEKQQWVQHRKVLSLIVLTNNLTADTRKNYFAGTALPCNSYTQGRYCTDFVKENFQPLEGEIPFIISNND